MSGHLTTRSPYTALEGQPERSEGSLSKEILRHAALQVTQTPPVSAVLVTPRERIPNLVTPVLYPHRSPADDD